MKILSTKIGFDFDGVIADIGEAFIRLACEDHRYCSIALEDITDFHVERCTDVPEIIVNRIFHDILEDSLAAGLLPIDGAIETLEKMSRLGPVTIITARSKDQPVSDWLENYLPADVCSAIQLIAMSDHDQKVRYIREHYLEYFVDDRGQTCAQIADAELTPILFRQPWNRSWNHFATADGWKDICRFLHL